MMKVSGGLYELNSDPIAPLPATLDEEEGFDKADSDVGGDDELRLLSEEGELDIEELRRRYGGAGAGQPTSGGDIVASSSSTVEVRSSGLTAIFAGNESPGEDDEDEEDGEYMPTEFWRKPVRIGPEYQVGLFQ